MAPATVLPAMQLRIGKALFISLFALLAGRTAAHATEAVGAITWMTQWNEALFAQAAREHRFVLLDLHAVWCHWGHVMDEQTYTDPKVRDLIERRYVAVSIDADSDPNLTSRYGDWGWPATIVLAPDGTEIVKRRGFMPAPQMASLLQAIIDDPTPVLALYRSSGTRRWLDESRAAMDFIAANFRDPAGGFIAAPVPRGAHGVFGAPIRAIDQNVAVARFANRLRWSTRDERYGQAARHAMKFLVATALTNPEELHADVLIADRELAASPIHSGGRQARSGRAAAARERAPISGRIPAGGLVGPCRGTAAEPRNPLPEPRTRRRVRLHAEQLLDPGIRGLRNCPGGARGA